LRFLILKTFVVILALLTIIHMVRGWITERKRQRRAATLKDWIHKQDKAADIVSN